MLSINCKVICRSYVARRQAMAEEAGGRAISCPTSTDISWVLSMPLHLFVVTLGLSIFRSSRKGQLGKRKHTNFACLCHPCFLPLFMVTHNQSSAKDNSSSPALQIVFVIILARVNPAHYEPSPCIL